MQKWWEICTNVRICGYNTMQLSYCIDLYTLGAYKWRQWCLLYFYWQTSRVAISLILFIIILRQYCHYVADELHRQLSDRPTSLYLITLPSYFKRS